jgi:hypothetical protein
VRASSRASLAETVESGESLQAETRSSSGGQVRVEITSAIEVGRLSLGVGIGGGIKEGGEQTSDRARRQERGAKITKYDQEGRMEGGMFEGVERLKVLVGILKGRKKD